MKDPYETLGVTRSATDKEIKDAFKKLARKFHPDLHPGDKDAEAKFKSISAANDLLKDKEKRRKFDAGEIDASGAERPQERFYRDFADGPAYTSHAAQDGFDSNEDLEEFLAKAFAGRDQRSQGTFRARGQDVSYVLPVAFLDAANGATRTITLARGQDLAGDRARRSRGSANAAAERTGNAGLWRRAAGRRLCRTAYPVASVLSPQG